jgi:hypothetical protein
VLCALAVLLSLQAASNARAGDITPAGKRLAEALDSMNVERLWLPGSAVAWKTGKPLRNQPPAHKPHSHCSAFVAAACARFDIYILRPPEHSTTQLANAQYDWLRQDGPKAGWKLVKTAVEAQELANQGVLVVASYKESDNRSGHIAIVRPCVKSVDAIEQEGPQIIQAGMTNYRSTSLVKGFGHHPAAWQSQRVRFFAHEIPGG